MQRGCLMLTWQLRGAAATAQTVVELRPGVRVEPQQFTGSA
jgi:hypothetical protein